MSQPIIINGTGIAIFGDASTIYIAQVSSSGGGEYTPLPTIKAKSFFHGWAVDSGNLYVLDGPELSMWHLSDGTKSRNVIKLTDYEDDEKQKLKEYQEALQRAEWATLLEQCEEEYIRLTADQNKAQSDSDERNQLDVLASDLYGMLKNLRKMVGCADPASRKSSRTQIEKLRNDLAQKKAKAIPFCFSAPVVRTQQFTQSQNAIFIMQGDGTLYHCDKNLTSFDAVTEAGDGQTELLVALMEGNSSFVAFISKSTLKAYNADTLKSSGHWQPTNVPPASSRHTLTAANGHFWWGTDQGIYAVKPVGSTLQFVTHSGATWSTRQVGRLGVSDKKFPPPPVKGGSSITDPNHLFESMNVKGWIAKRTNPTAPLNDGMMAHLMLSKDDGSYKSPSGDKTYLVHGPFTPTQGAPQNRWTGHKAHSSSPFVLFSDEQGMATLCSLPLTTIGSQLLPHWTTARWFSSPRRYSDLDLTLSQKWPTPNTRAMFEDSNKAQMWNKVMTESPLGALFKAWDALFKDDKKPTEEAWDLRLRFLLWHALFDKPLPAMSWPGSTTRVIEMKDVKAALNILYNQAALESLQKRFSGLGTIWEVSEDGREGVVTIRFLFQSPIPAFSDILPVAWIPWKWKQSPAGLFNGPPPEWVDPWGLNRPGDFFPEQPQPNFLDPFRFEGNLRFPQRLVQIYTGTKNRCWAVFTSGDSAFQGAPTSTTQSQVLVVTADEDQQHTAFQILPTQSIQPVSFDQASHTIDNPARELGIINKPIASAPTVFVAANSVQPTACCVIYSDFQSKILRKLADASKSESLWAKFVRTNQAAYGPTGSDTAWKIEKCPMPEDALPKVSLEGYALLGVPKAAGLRLTVGKPKPLSTRKKK
jgi:hypothetical protein